MKSESVRSQSQSQRQRQQHEKMISMHLPLSLPLSINNLPDELIEFILSFVPPYEDLRECRLVCKRWRRLVQNVVRIKQRQLHASLLSCTVCWQQVSGSGIGGSVNTSASGSGSGSQLATIASRFAHAAVVSDNSMYVFGGCTNSMTAFNDLWQLELSTRKWIRPVASGMYPIPKACCSMIYYKEKLIIFGGLAYPSSYPFHQSYQLFDELHMYEMETKRWQCVATNNPPPMAGHSVSVHGDHMVLFGGMQRCALTGNTLYTNDVWILDLRTMHWRKQHTNTPRPKERYGHSQTALDRRHALVMGGSGGPNGLYIDICMCDGDNDDDTDDVWQWKQVVVHGLEWAPLNTWCHPICQVGQYIVVLNPSRINDEQQQQQQQHHHQHQYQRQRHIMHSATSCCLPRPQSLSHSTVHRDSDENVNGRRGVLSSSLTQHQNANEKGILPITSRHDNSTHIKIRDSPRIGHLSLSAFAIQPTQQLGQMAGSSKPAARNRERQLELLRKMEAAIKERRARAKGEPRKRSNVLGLYLLDTSRVLSSSEPESEPQPHVSWLESAGGGSAQNARTGPEETLLYTLVQGKGELIMFGGIQKQTAAPAHTANAYFNPPPCSYSANVSNRLHFLCPPIHII